MPRRRGGRIYRGPRRSSLRRRQPLHPRESAFRKSPETHRDEALLGDHGASLPGKRKLIVDSRPRRGGICITLEDGVEIGGAALNPILFRSRAYMPAPRKEVVCL